MAQKQTELSEDEEKYRSPARGAVQKRYQDVVNEAHIVLSYYSKDLTLRSTNYYHHLVEYINQNGIMPAAMRFTSQELALTAEMVDFHFAEITQLSNRIDRAPNADLYFARAMEFAIVQDYTSAIDDCTRALSLTEAKSPLTVIATFCRANWRYKLLEFKREAGEATTADQLKLEFEVLLRDYDEVIRQQPDFAFAYYNRANMLCTQRDYEAAIRYYTKAIEVDGEFAEAYFNRGLTYIYTDENEKGLNDLSKAGELGIYQAYNLISRFK